MTVAVALICSDGALLASDSMGTSGTLASNVTKIRSCPGLPLAWTWAGSSYLGQEAGRALSAWAASEEAPTLFELDIHSAAELIVERVRQATSTALQPLLAPSKPADAHDAEFLIASRTKDAAFVAHILPDLSWELKSEDRLIAIGSGHKFAAVTQGLMRHYIEGGLTLEQAKAVAYRAIQTVCEVSSFGVSMPVQMAVVSEKENRVLSPDDIDGIGLTVDRWKTLERETLQAGSSYLAGEEKPPTLRQ